MDKKYYIIELAIIHYLCATIYYCFDILFLVAQVYAIIPNITTEKGTPTSMKNIPLSIYLLFLLVLLISGCKLAKKKTCHEDFLDYPIMKGIQGFAAMAVILHHVTQTVTLYGQFDKGLINIFVDAGVLFTGLFFFCSGYGLMTSLLKKEDYLNGFITKLHPIIGNDLLFYLVVYVGTMVLAIGVHWFNKKVICILRKS